MVFSFDRNSANGNLRNINRAVVVEITLYIGAYIVYLVSRDLIHEGTRAVGLVNAGRIVSLQKELGFLWEPSWQSWALENTGALVVTMNWVYIITYWPVIFLAAFILFIKNRRDYRFYRTVVFVNLAAAILPFMIFILLNTLFFSHKSLRRSLP